ncbi:PadR family transcriptional regulator [Beijerinckia indica]|uniref:Transcriptional regulator, PadR-like family n=1 Tax=Beijerinckia indica subsp. indica (strain ATCC 9039 / DSM 1715 / NCIMB 8712) TaxID=395963 RepID=B2IKL6_BEII9|nr:PadR family transcriptional regulator [Beijerinckia indica]ACB95055.1 transcriptional regulator, PadR-like family [Beijerinckia indica subsp. indica ATCC 9039]
MTKEHIHAHKFHHFLHSIGRRRGPHGFGRGWAEGFGRGFGGGDFSAGRKLSSNELQLVLLALLAERPAHGYELIRMLEERSGGFYAPSPGMVYPALTYLEEIGHASVTQEGNRKLYSLTEEGRQSLQAHREEADFILETLARIGSRMAEVREAFAGVDAADPQAADELHQARHAIKHALMRKRGCSPAEARRIAGILQRATAEILEQSN